MKLRPNVFTAKKTGKANWKTLDFLTYMYRVFLFYFSVKKKGQNQYSTKMCINN